MADKIKIIDPFTNITLAPIKEDKDEVNGSTFLSDLRSLNIGSGANVFRADQSGMWLGSERFGSAPFRVSMAGDVTANSIILTGGVIKYGKTSFNDNVNSGYYISSEGIYFGASSDFTKLKYTLADGTLDFVGSHSGGDIDGVPVAQVGYVSTAGSDIVPTGLACLSTAATVASDGTVSASVVLNWNAVVSNTFNHYVIRYKKNAHTYYNFVTAKENTITIEGLTPNTNYNFGIASVNKYGTISAYSTDINQLTAKSTVPPAKVVSDIALAGIQYVIVQWNNNTEPDLAIYNVYRNTSNDSSGATLMASVKTNYFTDGGLTAGQPYYYWIKAVNTSGLESVDFSDVVNATPRNVVSADANIAQLGWTQTSVFSVSSKDKVSWGAGVFTASDGTSYNISAGNTSNMTAKTYIYLDLAVSTTEYQTTTTAGQAVGDGKVLIGVAQDGATEAVFQIFGGSGGIYINGSDLVAGSITSNEIAANTIQAGNIKAGTITANEIDTTTITSLSDLSISAPQVLIDGTVYLSNWRHSGDLTKIDGGNIYANSITTSQLNFTPILSTNVIASINASTEGVAITGDRISISGSTAFASGYDPSLKVDEVAGSYSSALTGARVLIFPDANTGIQAIDNNGKDVFKVIVGGTDVGDVIIGDYSNGQGLMYDKSTGKTTFAGMLSAPSGTLGTITAGTINGTTITGGKVRTSSGNTRVELNGSDNSLNFYYYGDLRASFYDEMLMFYDDYEDETAAIYADSSGFLIRGENNSAMVWLDAGKNSTVAIGKGGSPIAVIGASGIYPYSNYSYSVGNISRQWEDIWNTGTHYYRGAEQPVVFHGTFYVGDSYTDEGNVSWKVTKQSTGVFRVTHNLGTYDYSVTVSVMENTTREISVQNKAYNYFEVRIYNNSSSSLTDSDFCFILATNEY